MFNQEPADYSCPFCSISNGGESERTNQSAIVFQDTATLAFVSPKWWINNPGNVIVIPRAHFENVFDIPGNLLAAVQIVGKKIAIAMEKSYGCDGISFRQHNGAAGNQDVWHYHLHVFPRWEGDNLYLNHDKKRLVSVEEKLPYIQKLKHELKKHT